MSASAANISANASSVTKGENLIDTCKTIEKMGADVIIIRHPMSGAPHLASQYVDASIINAGDGINEHPTQSLLDLYTIREKKTHIEGLKIAIVGDILHSRVARSNIWGLVKLGADVNITVKTSKNNTTGTIYDGTNTIPTSKGASDYINQSASFLGEITRNENGEVNGIVFIQQKK